ncbi:Glutamate receptor ionotropic, delta-1-like 23 [Homarus americanus]|uniref:Glutamate receptor ionotropic, delta-1-like 23 n=1 Tax=Homarus americanus TaxID=6706 RepID=A0A8J5KE76_HOMAM|nr:Glutamate receptor ionotropic, delta-1-like 23 [Homarus americanus]
MDGTTSIGGVFGGVLSHLQEITNFTYSCRPSRDGQWGSVEDGRWTGMIKDLVDDVADFAVAYRMVMKKPSTNDQTWTTFTQEFHLHVWAVLVASIVVFAIILYLISITEKGKEKFRISDSVTIVLGALCGQGTEVEYRRLSSRLVLLILMLLHVVLLAHYTSNLVSALAVGPALPAISSISDVVRSSSLSLGTVRDTAPLEYLKLAYKNMMAKKDHVLVGDTLEGMQKTLKENYIYFDTGIYVLNAADCRHLILPNAVFTAITSFALQKGSPLVPVFNQIILKMKMTGILHKLEQHFGPPYHNCDQTQSEATELAAVLTPFLLLIFVIGLSICCCLAEHLHQEVTSTLSLKKPGISPKYPKNACHTTKGT